MQYLIENWVAVVAICTSLSGLIISPLALYRYRRNKNKTKELGSLFEQQDLIIDTVTGLNKRILALEKEVHDLNMLIMQKDEVIFKLKNEKRPTG